MLIIPYLNPNKSLFLDAYSYQLQEIEAVAFTLRQVIEGFEIINLERDRMDRIGKRHAIAAFDVPRLEKHLEIRFQGEGPTTTMIVDPPGKGYRCKEISARGLGTGCVNMSAHDQPDAMVKCALLARQNGWFGGEAEVGDCMSKMGKFFERLEKPFKK
jgi:hypothetical protein